jgi:hypothetical protein
VGQAVAQLVAALCCKPEGGGIQFQCGGFFQFTLSFQPHYGPGVETQHLTEKSTRNLPGGRGGGGVKGGWHVGVTTLPPSVS